MAMFPVHWHFISHYLTASVYMKYLWLQMLVSDQAFLTAVILCFPLSDRSQYVFSFREDAIHDRRDSAGIGVE